MNIGDHYVVLWDSRYGHFHIEKVAAMVARNRDLFARDTPKEYILLSFEKTQAAANAAAEEFDNIRNLADASERMMVLQEWPTEPIERPVCPKCKGAMVRRTASKGPNPGKQFWGCLDYPNCKGTVNV